MDDFSDLTPELAAANIRAALENFVGTKQQHAILDASLAMCGITESVAPSPNGVTPVAVPS